MSSCCQEKSRHRRVPADEAAAGKDHQGKRSSAIGNMPFVAVDGIQVA